MRAWSRRWSGCWAMPRRWCGRWRCGRWPASPTPAPSCRRGSSGPGARPTPPCRRSGGRGPADCKRAGGAMKPRLFLRWLFVLAALPITGGALAADLQVMISAGFYAVYSELGPAFERASGHRLVTTRGPSMGDSPEAIPTRLARGEGADIVIMDGTGADYLGSKGLVRADSKVVLARSLIG